MKQKIELTNDFHNTSINLVAEDNYLSPSQTRRARKALCGISTCLCSGIAGVRGPQFYETGERFRVCESGEQDGSAVIETDDPRFPPA